MDRLSQGGDKPADLLRSPSAAALLAGVFETSVEGIVMIDDRGLIESINPSAQPLFGYEAGEVIGRNVKMLMPAPYAPEHDAYLANYLRTGERKIIGIGREVVGLRKDGSTFPMYLSVSEANVEGRRIFTGFVQDFTARKEAERQIAESASRLRAIFDASVEGIITISERGIVESMNAAAQALFGFAAPDVVGRNVNMLMPSPYAGEHDGYLDNYLRTGNRKIIGIGREVMGRRRDGTTFPMYLSVSEVPVEGGRIFTGFVRDLTERRQGERLLAEGVGRMRAVLETAVEGIITINERGIVESMNPAAKILFGYANGEVVGRNVSMLMPSPYAGEHDGYLANYLRTGDRKIIGIGREVTGRRKDGSTFPMHLSVSEAAVEGGRIFTGFVQDLTERKEHERILAEWVKELERKVEARTEALTRANRELEHMCYVISHDLRNPLRGVRNYANFIREDLAGKLEGESASDLEGLARAADELNRMFDDMLAYAKIGRGELAEVEIDLGQLCDEIARAAAAPGREVVVAPGLPKIRAPYVLVRQVFENLIQNGLHYNRSERRRVEVSASPARGQHGQWVVAIRDNGIGIDPAYHEKIFEMFHRLNSGRDFSGTGIGLASVKKALDCLGGSIQVESQAGAGSTFWVDLPDRPPVR